MNSGGDITEIRNLALMFGWDSHTDDFRRQDTFLHGQHMVTVDYTSNDLVKEGKRYEFASIKNPQLRETTRRNHKKSDVRYWLVKLGH